jgi:hypothetical protein
MDTDDSTRDTVQKRLPVWKALSEFFLDTELTPKELERIAQELAKTCYSEDELEQILAYEVCPGCRVNMFLWAWIAFDEDWLLARINPYLGKRSWFMKLLVGMNRWMYQHYWKRVKPRILEIRAQKI